jgi:hypothetical protein
MSVSSSHGFTSKITLDLAMRTGSKKNVKVELVLEKNHFSLYYKYLLWSLTIWFFWSIFCNSLFSDFLWWIIFILKSKSPHCYIFFSLLLGNEILFIIISATHRLTLLVFPF